MEDVTGLVIIDGHADVRRQQTKLVATMDDRVGLQGKLVARMGDRVGLQGILLQLDAGEVVTKVQGILLQPVAGALIHFCSLIQVQFHLEEHMLLYSSTSPINRLTIGGVVLSADSTQVLLLMLILGIVLYLCPSPQLVSVLTQRFLKQNHLIHFKKVIQLLKYIQLQIILSLPIFKAVVCRLQGVLHIFHLACHMGCTAGLLFFLATWNNSQYG
jgi:hypothetical protein